MEQLEFLVKGSSKDPYEVTFIKDGDSLTAICTCPAGTYGNFCKHRISVLDGDSKAISSDNADKVATVVTFPHQVNDEPNISLVQLSPSGPTIVDGAQWQF